MLTADPWFWLCVVSALAGGGLAVLLLLHVSAQPDLMRRHAFFVFFFLVVDVYLQLAPLASLASSRPPDILAVYRIPPPQQFVREYAIVQVLCLLFFQLPLFVAYVWPDRRPVRPVHLAVEPWRGRLLAAGALAFAGAFLFAIARNNLWFLRLGADVLAQRVVALPFADFLVFRSYQETALLLIGVLFFAATRATGSARRWLAAAFAVNVLLTGGYNLLVSRWFIVSLAVCLGGWWLATRRRLYWTPRMLGLLIAGGGFTLYLMIVAVNVRNVGWQNVAQVATFSPFGSVFGDTQGVGRLNCVDLMARLLPGIQERGPTYGASWGQVIWLVRRFVDPEGFDRYRLTMATTAKAHLMQEYLDWQLPDYFSCTATDLFGTFHVVGLLVGALVLAALFRFAGRAIIAPRTRAHVILGIFIVTHILIFDQEAATSFFGWPRRLPVLLLLLLLNPFTMVGPPRVETAASAPR
jgi:hypothetical protein